MAEKKDPIRSLIDTGRRAGKLTSSEISDAMEENGNVLDVEAMEKLYEELESNGIEIVDDTPVDVSSALPSSEEGADDYEDGLTADGIAGPQTIAKIDAAYESKTGKSSSSATSSSASGLKLNSKGTDVRNLQQDLTTLGYYWAEITGNFGAKTETAVKRFQEENGLTADGVAGAKTLNAIAAAVARKGGTSASSSKWASCPAISSRRRPSGPSFTGPWHTACSMVRCGAYCRAQRVRRARNSQSCPCAPQSTFQYSTPARSLQRIRSAQ